MLLLLGILVAIFSLNTAQQNTIFFQVKEEQNPGAFVGDVSKTDYPNRLKRGGFTIRYAIQDSTQKVFKIDSATGIVRTNQILDRENLPSSARGDVFQIQIVFSDSSGSLTVVSPTEVKILDINDNDPKFPKDFEALSIKESAPVNSRFQLSSASDADIGNNSIQSYKIISGNEDGMFSLLPLKLSPSVMHLYLVNVKKLDREVKDFYRLQIAAIDGGTPLPRAGKMALNITILDSNDHSPQFSTFNYVSKVRENAPNGTFVIRVTATDKDIGTNGKIKYSLDPLPSYDGLFKINPQTGKVWTNAPLDYEKQSKYVLSVSAQDLGPDSIPAKASISVEVLDENDQTPEIIVTYVQSAIDKYGRVPEDVKVHRSVAIIDVTDDDSRDSNNSYVDLFMDRYRNDFSIQQLFKTRYVLKVDRPLNLTRQGQYRIKLTARDRGKPPKESKESFTLRIADKNRHKPNFTKPVYSINIIDDTPPGTLISRVKAHDPDTGREGLLEYTIKYLKMGKKNISNPGDFFTFGKFTGELHVIPKLWCAFTPSFEMLVEAKDHGRVRGTGTALIKLIVECAKFQYNFTVRENRKAGAEVGSIVLNPPFPGKQLSFTIINNAQQSFSIDANSGLIKTKKMLDREVAPSHALIVEVTDGINDMRLQVLVNVNDENDNAPIFIGINDNHEVSVSSTAKRGDEVVIVTATDPDHGRNGKIKYFLISGNDDKTFLLDKDRGVLIVYDYLFESSYELKIQAMDCGVERKSSYVTLKVIVTLPYMISSPPPSDVPVYDTRAADSGLLKSKTMLVVVILCSIISLLVLVVIVVVIIKCYRRQGQTKTKNVKPLTGESSTGFGESELSREAAIKASKKMYSQATVNMYSSNEMLDGKKGKPLRVSQAQPLPLKSSFSSTSPPTSTTSPSHRLHNPPPYADIYPPISTTRPVSECFSSGDELDSGRGDDSSLPSSPYSCHTLGKPNSNDPKHYSTYKHPKRETTNCNHHKQHPVVTLPNRSHKKKTVTINDRLPHAHDATDL